jgi:nucleolar protein 14
MRAKLANKMRMHEEVAKPNPFELKFTRTKHQVLGKTSSKVVGAPIKAREKSQKTRSEKLLRELDKGGKRNALKDRRLKENDSRYAEVQKQKYAGGERSVTTDDTDTLTHFGRSIAELERLDDKPREVYVVCVSVS